MRAAGVTDLVGEFLGRLLVLTFDLDSVDDLLQSAPVVQQRYGQKEEAKAIDATDNSVESGQPRRFVDHISYA